LRSALAGYDKQPRSASTLNNSANLLSTLYEITHDPADSREALNRHEEALRLQPDDTVLLSNLESGYLEQLWLDMAPASADLKSLPAGIEVVLASLQHRNAAEQEQFTIRIRESAQIHKAIALLEKLIILAPRDPSHCRALQNIHVLCRDAEELKKLLTRVKGAAFDHAGSWTQAKKYWAENHVEDTVNVLKKRRQEAEAALADLKADTSAELRTALHIAILTAKAGISRIESTGSVDDLISGAEALLKLHKSSGSINCALSALLRAAVFQCSTDPGFAAFVKENVGNVDDVDLIALALQKGVGRNILLECPALRRWVSLNNESAVLWPDTRSVSGWAVLRHLDPPSAGACATVILKTDRILTDIELDQALTPFSVDTVLNSYFLNQLRGDEAAATSLWKESSARGMPLPAL
jgi:hypothetical protein